MGVRGSGIPGRRGAAPQAAESRAEAGSGRREGFVNFWFCQLLSRVFSHSLTLSFTLSLSLSTLSLTHLGWRLRVGGAWSGLRSWGSWFKVHGFRFRVYNVGVDQPSTEPLVHDLESGVYSGTSLTRNSLLPRDTIGS